jgi:hypothetical protein
MTDKNEALLAMLRYRLGKASGGQAIVDEDDLASVINIVERAGVTIETLAGDLRSVYAAMEALLSEAKDWAAVMCGERPSLDEAVALAEAAIAKATLPHEDRT